MGYRSANLFQIILEISKVRITFAVSITTFAGYIAYTRSYDGGFVLPAIGIFLLACGASVINHLQEQDTDAKMERTRTRPLPAKKITSAAATSIAIVEILAGTFLIWISAGAVPTALGILALIWYNLIYTNLKKVTANAVIPGSLIGAIPPLVGWTAAGGPLFQLTTLVIAVFFFVWQVPHFYLLALRYGGEYAHAGLPSLTKTYSIETLKKIIFYWIFLTSVTAVILPFSSLIRSIPAAAVVLLYACWLPFTFQDLLNPDVHFTPFRYFMRINYFFLTVVVMIILDPIFA